MPFTESEREKELSCLFRSGRSKCGIFDGFHRALDVVARERRFLSSEQAPPYESGAGFVASNIKNGNPQFVALDEDEVIGWCDVCRRSNDFFRPCGILGMGLLPQYRGRGIGTRLLHATLDDAKTKGFLRIELEVFATNRNAIALYEKHGFVQQGTRRMAAIIGDEKIDIHIMALFPELSVP